MDEETRDHCVEPFFSTKGEGGSGLGLAMVYGIMQRHGAGLEIESALGSGTTVRLVFSAHNPTFDCHRAEAPSANVKFMRILVIDDDPLITKLLYDALQEDGHRVTPASGGGVGIQFFRTALIEKDPFDVVLTDLGMPHIDGHKVANSVKALSPSTPVILLTGWGEHLGIDEQSPAPVDLILNKPPRLDKLREALAFCTLSKNDRSGSTKREEQI